jgi:DNA-binding IclR family transcriptional regulator
MARIRRGVLWAKRGCTADVRTALQACPEGLTVSMIARMTGWPLPRVSSVLVPMRNRGEARNDAGVWALLGT